MVEFDSFFLFQFFSFSGKNKKRIKTRITSNRFNQIQSFGPNQFNLRQQALSRNTKPSNRCLRSSLIPHGPQWLKFKNGLTPEARMRLRNDSCFSEGSSSSGHSLVAPKVFFQFFLAVLMSASEISSQVPCAVSDTTWLRDGTFVVRRLVLWCRKQRLQRLNL